MLRAAQAILEETSEQPILIGRPEVISQRCERHGLKLKPFENVQIVNPENDHRYRDYWGTYHQIMARRGVSPDLAKAIMRTNTTAIAAVMVQRDEVDCMICGTFGEYHWHLKYAEQILGTETKEAARRPFFVDIGRRPFVHCGYAGMDRTKPRKNCRDCRGRGTACAPLWGQPQNCPVCPITIRKPRNQYGSADA